MQAAAAAVRGCRSMEVAIAEVVAYVSIPGAEVNSIVHTTSCELRCDFGSRCKLKATNQHTIPVEWRDKDKYSEEEVLKCRSSKKEIFVFLFQMCL